MRVDQESRVLCQFTPDICCDVLIDIAIGEGNGLCAHAIHGLPDVDFFQAHDKDLDVCKLHIQRLDDSNDIRPVE